MNPDMTVVEFLRQSILIIVLCLGGAFLASVALFIVAARQIRDIDIPEGADFFETLQHVPITVPLALDLLDMAFDFFAAPVSWVILELLGLQALQMITVFEGLIPGTQLIPTMTLAWGIARVMKGKRRTPMRSALHDYQLSERRSRYERLSRGRPSVEEHRRRSLPGPDDDVIDGEYYEEDWGEEPPPDHWQDEEPWA